MKIAFFMMDVKLYIERHTILLLLLVYCAIATLLTGGLVFHLDSIPFGDYGDARGVIWAHWAKTNGLLDAQTNHLIAAPHGVPIVNDIRTPVSESISLILTKFFNEIAAYNIFVLLSFPITAVGTYLLLINLLQNKIAAFIGGLIFGFCPSAVMQASGGHAVFAFNVFIPIFLLALFYNRTQRTLFSATYVAASFSLVVLTSLYFGYFAIYIGIYFVAFELINSKREDRRPILFKYFVSLIFATFIIMPSQYKVIYHQVTASHETLVNTGRIQDIGQLISYSSRPWDFILPSVDHPIFGRHVYEFVRSHLHGSNVFEQTHYLGIIPMCLLIYGVILIIRGKLIGDLRTFFLFFTFGALWMYFLSLPPLLSIGDLQAPTLSWLAYKLTPMFRVYARFGILVNFFVACAVAVVLVYLFNCMNRRRYYGMVAFLLSIVIFEYCSLPLDSALPVEQPSKVYSWLAEQPGDIIVAEYPMMNSDEFPFYSYLFWQRIHKKRLVNGAVRNNKITWDFFEKIKNLDDPNVALLLQSAGVKYVIVHASMYQDGPIPQPIKRYYPVDYANVTYNGGHVPVISFPLKLVKSFGSDFVFAWDEEKNDLDRMTIFKSIEGGPEHENLNKP